MGKNIEVALEQVGVRMLEELRRLLVGVEAPKVLALVQDPRTVGLFGRLDARNANDRMLLAEMSVTMMAMAGDMVATVDTNTVEGVSAMFAILSFVQALDELWKILDFGEGEGCESEVWKNAAQA